MPDHAHHRLHPLLAALAGSTLLLAACGGGSSDHATPASPTTATLATSPVVSIASTFIATPPAPSPVRPSAPRAGAA